MIENCPFFGLDDDPETASTFPSDRNRCYRLSKSRAISLDHQSSYCLSANYPACPIYQMQEPKPLAFTNLSPPSSILANPFFWPIIVMILAFLSMIGLFLYARSIWGNNLNFNLFAQELSKYTQIQLLDAPKRSGLPTITRFVPPPTFTPTETLSPTATATDTPAPTVLAETITFTPSLTKRPIVDTQTAPTSTPYPSATVCAGPPYGWSRYTVRYGDTLNSIAIAQGVSMAQLQAANCLGNSIYIYVGQTLYVPYAATRVFIPTSTHTSIPSPTKTRRPTSTKTSIPPATHTITVPPSDTPVPPPSDTPVPPPSDTPVPLPSDTPVPPAPADTSVPYPI